MWQPDLMRSVDGPRDLPDLRLWFLDMWKGPFRPFVHTDDLRFAGDPRFGHLEVLPEIELLSEAELWWITPEMSRLISHAAASLPPTTLTDELIPRGRPVFAWFAEPLLGDDAAIEGHQITVRALLYSSQAHIIWEPDTRYATVSMYSQTPFEELPFAPVGRTDWRYGDDTEEPSFDARPDDDDARRAASMAQDRRWLAALNLLAAQPLAEQSIVKQTNKARIRKYRRTGLPSDVRLVGLRTAPREDSAEPGESRAVNWSHRWIVGEESGGFWKQQAYGPGWSLHRPIWILPFEKGPKDKPLIVKDTVHVLRGEQSDR